jgi:hypothetical protein
MCVRGQADGVEPNKFDGLVELTYRIHSHLADVANSWEGHQRCSATGEFV